MSWRSTEPGVLAAGAFLLVGGGVCPILWLVDGETGLAVMEAALLAVLLATPLAVGVEAARSARRARNGVLHPGRAVRGRVVAGRQPLVPGPISGLPCVWTRLEVSACGAESDELLHSETIGDDAVYLRDDSGKLTSIRPSTIRLLDLRERAHLAGKRDEPAIASLCAGRGLCVAPGWTTCSERSLRVGDPVTVRSSAEDDERESWLTDRSERELLDDVARGFRCSLLGTFACCWLPLAIGAVLPAEDLDRTVGGIMALCAVTLVGLVIHHLQDGASDRQPTY